MATFEPNGITEKLKAKCDSPNQFERFDNLFRQIVSVPKSAIDKEDANLKRRKKRAKKNARKRAG